jgi:hypothetical protein
VFFDKQTPEELAAAITRFETMDWPEQLLRSHARGFSVEVFHARMRAFLSKIGARVRESSPLVAGMEEMEEKTA